MGLNTTPANWTAAQVVTAAQMNTEVRDALTGIQAAWTAYTPSWTATTTNPTIGNGTLAGAYLQVGKTVHFRIQITFGSTTTLGSGAYIFGLPMAAINTAAVHAVGVLFHSARNMRLGYLTTVSGLVLTDMSGVNVTNAAPFAWVTGDTITVQGTFEAA